ncbi:unnamed protein product [Mycena citricolor]|uniref:Uncharacterized protein n=1 Tax=Mycena citricolor TaxID=2018698 RepID=A0AAD2HU12_9AGAR|nr:unnamed protein product [Mycena citricolor]
MAELPPPNYSPEDERASETSSLSDASTVDPQLLIISSSDAINFQKGYLGAEGERAAIEGEIQMKGVESGRWAKVSISLRTVEAANTRTNEQIELSFSQVVLWTANDTAMMPSSFLFAIPLMADTPQCLRTPYSSISHTLTATLHPLDSSLPISNSLDVHTRRYTAHNHSLIASPETHSIDQPTRIEVEVPRVTFKVGEVIPVYVTIPTPAPDLVVEQEEGSSSVGTSFASSESSSSSPQPEPSSSKVQIPARTGVPYTTILARSGASCRFHSSRPVQLRFTLHPPPFTLSAAMDGEYAYADADAECASISQRTVLHAVSFKANVHVSFVDISTRTERISTITIPIVILPPSAPLPQVAPSVDAAYSKKHDQPPSRTVRAEDSDAPRYQAGEAGPSAPPPFEERDAPPPFFLADTVASSSRLPTFLESESEIIIPSQSQSQQEQDPGPARIEGEGIDFGFPPSEHFDGHAEDLERATTPPPSMEMASLDTDVTQLATIREPEMLGLVLEQRHESLEEPPPPPPALDDPSDPPPSIYSSDFRSPDPIRETSSRPAASESHAPPPYLVPVVEEHVTRPPPYVD